MRLTDIVRLARKDKLPGGLGDKKTREDFDPEQIEKGIKVEMEHTTDPDLALEISIDHLTEDPKYYDKLETIEPEHGEATAASAGPKSWPFQFYNVGRNSYSVVDRKTGMEMCGVRGKIEGRKLRDMLLAAKAKDRASMCKVIREAVGVLRTLRLNSWCAAGSRTAAKDSKIDEMQEQMEDMDRTVDQLKRRQDALTGPEVDPQTAEAIRNSIQRRIDAVNEDRSELQTAIQKQVMQKCGRPGKRKK